MKKVAVLLAPGFEEAEAIVTLDILRRLNIEVETLACAESRAVVSYHDVPMVMDSTLAARQTYLYDAVVLPGGPQAALILPPVRRSSSLYLVMIRQESSFARYVLRPRACWAATVC